MLSRDPRFEPPTPAIERRVQALIDQMTLEEKITLLAGQANPGSTTGLDRLGIPSLRLADGPMGVHWWCEAATAYPATIAAAASWDPELWEQLGRALGRDCRARGVHILLAPGVNIYRSPLCGRNFEYAGEDPFLASRFATAYIRGVQDLGVSATIKHLACNFQEYDRHHVSSDVDERSLEELYLPAFRAAVEEAGVGALMTAYNLVNGVHASEHPWLLRKKLKGDWGFDGVVMSDWISTYSTVEALDAGLDLEMPEALWFDPQRVIPAVEAGEVKVATLDDKVRRLLRLAACFGWLDHPQLDESIPHDDPETAEVALALARAGCVLLENDKGLLPLDKRALSRVAVVGFGADAGDAVISGGGSAFTPPFRTTSVLQGLRAALGPTVEVSHARGPAASPEGDIYATSRFGSEHGPGLWGEYFNNNDLEGEPAHCRVDETVDYFWGREWPAPGIHVRQYSIRWSGFIDVDEAGLHEFFSRCRNARYRVVVDGTAIIDTWEHERNGMHRAELELSKGRHTVLVLWRKTRMSGNMKLGFRRVTEVVDGLGECVEKARAADVAVVCVGFDRHTESEGYDRPFEMSPGVEAMVRAVTKAQPNTVVVLTAGGNVDVSGWVDRVGALLHTWYPGQAGGRAVAEILLGDVEPSGRLPASFEKKLEDGAAFHSYHDDDGDRRVALAEGLCVGYRHYDAKGIEPRYPFGHGLSYTRFELGQLELTGSELAPGGELSAKVTVENVGQRRGAQVVQLYLRELEPRLPLPPKALAGFRKLWLEPGERRTVEIPIERRALEHYDPDSGWAVHPGTVEVLIGVSAAEVRAAGRFRVRV